LATYYKTIVITKKEVKIVSSTVRRPNIWPPKPFDPPEPQQRQSIPQLHVSQLLKTANNFFDLEIHITSEVIRNFSQTRLDVTEFILNPIHVIRLAHSALPF
jgi:hypothetical protein